MSSTAFNWLSRLLIVLGIALAWFTKSMIGTPGAIALALGMVCGLFILMVAIRASMNANGGAAAASEIAVKLIATVAVCLGLVWVSLFVIRDAVVPAFFGTLSTIDGSHGESNPLARDPHKPALHPTRGPSYTPVSTSNRPWHKPSISIAPKKK